MHVRPWSLLATLGVALLAACDDPGHSGHDDPADDGDTTAGDDQGTGPADTGETTVGSNGDGPDGSTGAVDSGDSADGSDGETSSSTGEPVDGYPADVLDALDLPWPPYD